MHSLMTLRILGWWMGRAISAVLLAVLLIHATGVLQDFRASISYPFAWDHAEGIVWEQAALIPGPRMYPVSQALPFIVFHYPPVFHLLAKLTLWMEPDLLSAGRLVSAVAMIFIAIIVGLLVWTAAEPAYESAATGRRVATIAVSLGLLVPSMYAMHYWAPAMRVDTTAIALSAIMIFMAIIVGVLVCTPAQPANENAAKGGRVATIAIALGLLVPCMHAMHYWAPTMRVDTVAIALSMMALLLAVWANGKFWLTTAALLLCVVSVYAKQTEISAGVAIFLVGLSRNVRNALRAASLAAITAVAALALLQWLTNGGFLVNVLSYNINPFSRWAGYVVLRNEARESLPLIALMVAGFTSAALRIYRQSPAAAWFVVLSGGGPSTMAERAATARVLVLVHFAVSGLVASATIFKHGSNVNYLIDVFASGCVLIGILLCDCRDSEWLFPSLAVILLAGVLYLPIRTLPDHKDIAGLQALVQRISAAEKPVASEEMTLNLRAGKPVIFEPDMVTVLTSLGRYDETPLVNMIRTQGFAFMITNDNIPGGNGWRSPAVDTAMREAYPRTEQIGGLWVHLPAK
jgi:hypothetical protein